MRTDQYDLDFNSTPNHYFFVDIVAVNADHGSRYAKPSQNDHLLLRSIVSTQPDSSEVSWAVVFKTTNFASAVMTAGQALQSLRRQNMHALPRLHHLTCRPAAFSAQGFNAFELMQGSRLIGHQGHFLVTRPGGADLASSKNPVAQQILEQLH